MTEGIVSGSSDYLQFNMSFDMNSFKRDGITAKKYTIFVQD